MFCYYLFPRVGSMLQKAEKQEMQLFTILLLGIQYLAINYSTIRCPEGGECFSFKFTYDLVHQLPQNNLKEPEPRLSPEIWLS